MVRAASANHHEKSRSKPARICSRCFVCRQGSKVRFLPARPVRPKTHLEHTGRACRAGLLTRFPLLLGDFGGAMNRFGREQTQVLCTQMRRRGAD